MRALAGETSARWRTCRRRQPHHHRHYRGAYRSRPYRGPPPQNVVDECPEPLQQLCSMPLYDPIVGQASLSCLALALAAVASSLRIFGREKVVFGREATTGTSTEAYFLGRSVAISDGFGFAGAHGDDDAGSLSGSVYTF